jgi:sugar (pentulose or hexulose) kinase
LDWLIAQWLTLAVALGEAIDPAAFFMAYHLAQVDAVRKSGETREWAYGSLLDLATGVFFGLAHDTTRAELGRAVLEGVAFALADGGEALDRAGARIERLWAIGGGARSLLWLRILASALDRTLLVGAGAELGPAFGAARLARRAEPVKRRPPSARRPPAAARWARRSAA